jgi:hypothetical protein
MIHERTVLLSIFLLITAAALPQGRGGAGGKGTGQGSSGQSGGYGRQGQGPQGQGQGQQGDPSGGGQQEQKHIRATEEQRDQIKDCEKEAKNIRNQVQRMAQTPAGKFNADEARRRMDQIQNQLRVMEQEHERLMNGLDESQRQAFGEQIQNANRLREEFQSRLRLMNSELGQPNPDPERVRERAREMEQTMKAWEKEYQAVYSLTRS